MTNQRRKNDFPVILRVHTRQNVTCIPVSCVCIPVSCVCIAISCVCIPVSCVCIPVSCVCTPVSCVCIPVNCVSIAVLLLCSGRFCKNFYDNTPFYCKNALFLLTLLMRCFILNQNTSHSPTPLPLSVRATTIDGGRSKLSMNYERDWQCIYWRDSDCLNRADKLFL